MWRIARAEILWNPNAAGDSDCPYSSKRYHVAEIVMKIIIDNMVLNIILIKLIIDYFVQHYLSASGNG